MTSQSKPNTRRLMSVVKLEQCTSANSSTVAIAAARVAGPVMQQSEGSTLFQRRLNHKDQADSSLHAHFRTRGQLPESIKRRYLRDVPLVHDIPARLGQDSSTPAGQNVQSAGSEANTQLFLHPDIQSLVDEDRIARALGRDVTSDRLLVVYVSSFESTISKWATLSNQPPGISQYPTLHNTLYDRVQRLDHKASALIRQHTGSDHCHRATRVLKLAVMTFSSQSSCIERAETSQAFGEMFVPVNDFQSLLFQTLWHETRRSLEWFADWDCLEVILARIIFSLTQSPLNHPETDSRHEGVRNGPHLYDSPESMALRKAHLDKALQSLSFWNREMQPLLQVPERLEHSLIGFNDDDITDFCVLVKLAIIYDETTAVLWNRTIQITEGKGDISWSRGGCALQSSSPDSIGQAGQFLKAHYLKASLWRKLGQLQRLARHADALTSNLETYIQETLEIFHEWNGACASYMKTCMESITTSPFDLEASCFGHAAHWYLGVLLFATEVEVLDATGRSDSIKSSLRRSTGLTGELRTDSIYAISDLARAANSLTTEGLTRQRRTYYEHPLLVDPLFAVIHIAFAETCETLLEWRNLLLLRLSNENLDRSIEDTSQDETFLANLSERLNHCIEALDLLGKKSGVSKGYACRMRTVLDMGLYWPDKG
ncbi:C6 transcription factor AlcR [Talaromyces stipitatus ATCC 10500]|uniref:C6 transcription factor AlcR n=1 Tax=Talaromyces stipitatus (strain ATCC 10500 / CBS 375.48 / QM 6759 / NRRL 1006) TaxID=441959 RepID=B8LW17_TALSN|nr:C6 transcription factor AlcR [Talaromyces stipitatus ATCC 10500]EED24383.1 C6 transcription factor AlcR [Talaromyces stipitatus ATCC 10500]